MSEIAFLFSRKSIINIEEHHAETAIEWNQVSVQMVNDNSKNCAAVKQLGVEADVFFSLSYNSQIVA
jgi:hypothetical protein